MPQETELCFTDVRDASPNDVNSEKIMRHLNSHVVGLEAPGWEPPSAAKVIPSTLMLYVFVFIVYKVELK